MKFDKDMLLLYAITDRKDNVSRELYEQVRYALEGGITMLQLREKTICDSDLIYEATEIKNLCHRYGVPLIINDRVDIALKIGADGVHVGMEDMPVCKIREIAGKDFIIGATAKTVSQAKIAESEGADYIGVGAVFPSPTKKNAIRITPEQLNEICCAVDIPAVAIGGINLNNISELSGCKINGFAVVSAIFSATDIKKTTEDLKHKINELDIQKELSI